MWRFGTSNAEPDNSLLSTVGRCARGRTVSTADTTARPSSTAAPREKRSWADRRVVVGAVIALGTLIRIPQLTHSLNDAYAFRQTQTALLARGYVQHGIDLSRSPLPVFGPRADVPLEFPLFQAVAALVSRLGIPLDMACRLVGLVSFEASALLLVMFVTRWHGRRVALLALIFLEFLPFGLQWGAASLIDFFAVALSLLMVVGLDRWFSYRSFPWLLAGIAGSVLGFLVKVTTVPSWGFLVLASAIVLLRRDGWRRSWRRLLVGTALGPGIGLLGALAWTAYADSVKRQNPLLHFLESSSLTSWNFGTTAQRSHIANYGTIISRISQLIAGPGVVPLLLAVLAICFSLRGDRRVVAWGWLGVALSGPLVFFNLYVVHEYYLIAIYPALAVLMAIGINWVGRAIAGRPMIQIPLSTLACAIGLTTIFYAPGTRADMINFLHSQPIPAGSRVIERAVPQHANVIMIGCDWDPTTLYYAHRSGLMLRQNSAGAAWSTNPINEYSYLFACDPQPGLHISDFLPTGYVAKPMGSGIFRVERD